MQHTAEIHDPTALDQQIDRARQSLRTFAQSHPDYFGGAHNPRRSATLAVDAPYGTIDVPPGVNIQHTEGLMAAVDLTLLDSNATTHDIEQLARRAKAESAAAVCVYPQHVAQVQAITDGNPPPIAVVGFPAVADPVSARQQTFDETRIAIRAGAREIDMVLPLNFREPNPDYQAHYEYLRHIIAEASEHQVPVKVILETAYLTDAQKIEASLLAKMAGAAFVKTSTGFAEEHLMQPTVPCTQKGATAEDVALMRRTVGDTTLTDDGNSVPMGVKASGGVRNRAQALAMYEAGANRIGASIGLDVRNMAEKQLSRAIEDQARVKSLY